MKMEKNNQDLKQKRYVVFLDILGFSNFIENNDIENVQYKLNKFLCATFGLAGWKVNSNPQNKFDIYLHKDINFILLSDSIILYTNNGSSENFNRIVETTSIFLLKGLEHKFPLRGAITCGELFVNEEGKTDNKVSLQQIYGKALVKAYRLEGTQKWSGCIIDNEIIEELNHNEKFSIYKKKNYILKYNVPSKICNKEYYVVNWIKDKNSILKNQIEKAFYEDETKVDDSVKIKFCNTLKFYEWIVENNGRFIYNLSREQNK